MKSIEDWRVAVDAERNQAQGAATVRKSMVAAIAGVAGLIGAVISAVVSYFVRSGHSPGGG